VIVQKFQSRTFPTYVCTYGAQFRMHYSLLNLLIDLTPGLTPLPLPFAPSSTKTMKKLGHRSIYFHRGDNRQSG